MPIQIKTEVYGAIVHLSSGKEIVGFVLRGGSVEKGSFIIISRTPDMDSATYINRQFITHIELHEVPNDN